LESETRVGMFNYICTTVVADKGSTSGRGIDKLQFTVYHGLGVGGSLETSQGA